MIAARPIRTIYPCEEFGKVEVPIAELMKDGELDIYPDTAGGGFFDIDYRRGSLLLRATRYVGLIPISDRVAIHVRPRVPVANLLRLLRRGGSSAQRLAGFQRGYATYEGTSESLETLYLDSFLAPFQHGDSFRFMKRYRHRESDRELRGRFLLSRSVSRSFSKGDRHRPYFEVHDFGFDCAENRVIKATAERLLRFCASQPSDKGREAVGRLKALVSRLVGVSSIGAHPTEIVRDVPRLIRGLPNHHRDYEGPLWLSYLLASGRFVSLEQVGGTKFETLVVDAAAVFENYVRQVCVDAADPVLDAYTFHDGNKRPQPLFQSGVSFKVQPDIYVSQQRLHIAVLDAKYKPKLSSSDRYEVLGFCAALGVKKAALICPGSPTRSSTVRYGQTKSGVDMRIIYMRIDQEDQAAAEQTFLGELRDFLTKA